jgi:SPOR domain
MSNYERFLIGGIGALAPVLMFLVSVDWERYIVNATTLTVVGYSVRVLILFFIGGFVAYLHNDERQPVKLFELGLGAPALIAGAITSSLVPTPAGQISSGTRLGAAFSIVDAAFAQPEPIPQSLKRFSLPAQSPTDQFFQGLVGGTPKNVWFVIVGSYQQVENAQKQADQINQQHPEFKAEVYEPYGDNPNYAVVIGANLTQSEAKALRDRAVKAGLPTDSYYKTFPNLPPAGAATGATPSGGAIAAAPNNRVQADHSP